MKNSNEMKALFIVINAGFSGEVIAMARAAGAGGATVLNARGEGAVHKSFMGITVDSEREMVLTLVPGEIAKNIMETIKEKAGIRTPANGICFVMPVDKMTQIS